jgi:hypothetical protein
MLRLPFLSYCDSECLAWYEQVVLVHGLSDLVVESHSPVLIAARKIIEVNGLIGCLLWCLGLQGVLHDVHLLVEPLNLVSLGHLGEELATLREGPFAMFQVKPHIYIIIIH